MEAQFSYRIGIYLSFSVICIPGLKRVCVKGTFDYVGHAILLLKPWTIKSNVFYKGLFSYINKDFCSHGAAFLLKNVKECTVTADILETIKYYGRNYGGMVSLQTLHHSYRFFITVYKVLHTLSIYYQ